jgi:signal peptidase I
MDEDLKVTAIADEEKKESVGEKKKRSSAFYWIRDIIIALVIAILLLQFANPTMVKQMSMMDTLNDGDYIFINKRAYTFGEVEHGDIIVFQTQEKDYKGKPKKLIKRAIALPGDSLKIEDGKVYLNHKLLKEPYIREQYTDGDMPETVMPANKIFAMGDNRADSRDSREADIGFVDMDMLRGQAVFRIYPFDSIGTLK